MDKMAIGMGIVKDMMNRNFLVLEATQDNLQVKISVTDEDNYEQDIDTLVAGLQAMKEQMRQAKSGLIAVEGVIPDGFGIKQGRSSNGTRSPSKSRTRPPTR